MVYAFNGREFAKKKENNLRIKVQDLRERGITPKLVSILVGDDAGSRLYVSLKKKAGERIGCIVEVKKFHLGARIDESIHRIKSFIKLLNQDRDIHGIMIQLPLPENLRSETANLINAIAPEKDVDGLIEGSPYTPATVKAVLEIMDQALKIVRRTLKEAPYKVCVVGASGMVGRPLVKLLKENGYSVIGVDLNTKYIIQNTKDANVLISATGVLNLIKGNMVKEGAIVIDVGSPKGDVDFDSVSKKASFISPVPGGVGPVTIFCLLENLVNSASLDGKAIS